MDREGLLALGSRIQHARQSNDTRHMDAPFIDLSFLPPKRCVGSNSNRSVVGREDDDGLVANFLIVDRFQNPTDALIQRVDHRCIGGVTLIQASLIFRDQMLGSLKGIMRGAERDHHAKWLAFVACLNLLGGFSG